MTNRLFFFFFKIKIETDNIMTISLEKIIYIYIYIKVRHASLALQALTSGFICLYARHYGQLGLGA
jgi:hypothetical protein